MAESKVYKHLNRLEHKTQSKKTTLLPTVILLTFIECFGYASIVLGSFIRINSEFLQKFYDVRTIITPFFTTEKN